MKLLKRTGLGILVGLFFSISLLTLIPPSEASAAGEENMCIPNHTSLGGNSWTTDAFDFEFVSRFEIRVIFNETTNCGNLLHPSGLAFATFAEQTLFLRERQADGSNLVVYALQDGEGGSGASLSDETEIETMHWEEGLGINTQADPTNWEMYAYQDDAGINSIFNEAEYTLGIEQNLLNPGVSCGNNDNLHLAHEGGRVHWYCHTSTRPNTGADAISGMTNRQNFNITFRVSQDGQALDNLFTSDAEMNFTYCSGPGQNYYRNDGCNGNMIINGVTQAELTVLGADNMELTVNETGGGSFRIVAAGSDYAAGSINGPGALGDVGPSCESEGGSFSWLLCPALDLTSRFLQFVDNQVISLLNTPREYYVNDSITDAWGRMRNIAFIILIPILLLMVIGTALGFGFVDAYTIKRALPRLLVAVLFISLSLQISQLAIDVGNSVGRGVLGLITGALAGERFISLEELFNPSAGQGLLFTGGVFVAGVLALGMIPVILLFGLSAGLALFSVFLLLAFRQMMLVGLIIVSPLAILGWIFPGNDKLWKIWYNAFSKLILLFPIVMFLIGSGKVFAYIIDATPSTRGDTNFLETILILVAYVGPYFLIPATFKLAGGAFANIAGMANNRGRGAFDRLKKARGKRYQQRWQDAKSGNYFKRDNFAARKISSAMQTATLAPAGGLTLSTDKRRARVQNARNIRDFDVASKFLEENEVARSIKGDDDKMWAVINGRDEKSIREELKRRAPGRFSDPAVMEQAVQEVVAFRRAAGDRVAKVAAGRAQASTGTGFNYRHDGVDDDVIDTIIDITGDDRQLSGRMWAEMKGNLTQSGRGDIGSGGFAKTMITMDKRRVAKANGGFIEEEVTDRFGKVILDPTGKVMTRRVAYTKDDALNDMHQDVLQSNAGAAVAGKVEGVRQLVPVMKANVDDAITSGNSDKIKREFAKIMGKHDAASQIAPQNAEVLADELFTQKIQVGSLPEDLRKQLEPILATSYQLDNSGKVALDANNKPTPTGYKTEVTYAEVMEDLRKDGVTQTMRREYEKAGLNAAQMAALQAQQQGQNPAAQYTPSTFDPTQPRF